MTTFAFTRKTYDKKSEPQGITVHEGRIDLSTITTVIAVNGIFGQLVPDENYQVLKVEIETTGFAGATVLGVGDSFDVTRYIATHTAGAGYVKSTINQLAESAGVVTKGTFYYSLPATPIDLKFTGGPVPTTGIIHLTVYTSKDKSGIL
jgi:hypothetical protein